MGRYVPFVNSLLCIGWLCPVRGGYSSSVLSIVMLQTPMLLNPARSSVRKETVF